LKTAALSGETSRTRPVARRANNPLPATADDSVGVTDDILLLTLSSNFIVPVMQNFIVLAAARQQTERVRSGGESRGA
jgi:hypothetical protein